MLPHTARAITIVVLIQTISLLVGLRRDPRHHQRRAGLCLDQPAVPDLPRRAPEPGCSAGGRRRRRRRHSGEHRRDLPDARRAALRGTMRLEIFELHQQLGKTMVYVTHDQVEAMTMADKIVVLNAGNVEQVGARSISTAPRRTASSPASSAARR